MFPRQSGQQAANIPDNGIKKGRGREKEREEKKKLTFLYSNEWDPSFATFCFDFKRQSGRKKSVLRMLLILILFSPEQDLGICGEGGGKKQVMSPQRPWRKKRQKRNFLPAWLGLLWCPLFSFPVLSFLVSYGNTTGGGQTW